MLPIEAKLSAQESAAIYTVNQVNHNQFNLMKINPNVHSHRPKPSTAGQMTTNNLGSIFLQEMQYERKKKKTTVFERTPSKQITPNIPNLHSTAFTAATTERVTEGPLNLKIAAMSRTASTAVQCRRKRLQ